MKRLRTVVFMAMAGILVAGCLPDNEGDDPVDLNNDLNNESNEVENSVTDEEVSEQTLVVDLVADAVSMDPAQATDVNSHRVHYNMYDTLIRWDESGFELEPGVAESWEESDDGLQYVFELREDITFHDGTVLDAEAVKFSFERILDEDHPYHHTGPFPQADFYYGMVESIDVLDEFTIQFTLEEQNASFLFNLATIIGGIVSPAAVEEHGEDFAQNGVGSGPFQLERWQRGVQLDLSAFDEYWDGAPGVDRLVIQPTEEDIVRVTRLMTGESDLVFDVNPDSVPELEEDEEYQLYMQASPHLWYAGLNLRKEPFDDERVRQAVNYAVDKEAIVDDILNGTGVPATQPLAPVYNGHDESIEGYPYDPERAMELMEEAGYGDGVDINFVIPQSGSGMQSPVEMSTVIQNYLSDIGFNVEIERMEWGAFLDEVNQGGRDVNDMWALSWMSLTGDDDNIMTNLYSSDNIPLFNSGYYENEEVTDLLNEARQETDLDQRSELYHEASRIITDEAAMMFVNYANQTAASSSDVSNFQLHPSQMMDLRNVEK